MSDHLKPIVEALLFASPEPLTPKTLYRLLDGEPREDVDAALAALRADYDRPGGLQIVEVAGGFQIVTRTELHEWVRKLFHERTTQKLSVQALETLAVIAYKQPITAPEIAEIRGVSSSGGVLSTLVERRLIKTVGRKQVVGRPFMYATTREFLERFGLNDITDLPKVEEMADALGFELPTALAESATAPAELPFDGAPEQEEEVPVGVAQRSGQNGALRSFRLKAEATASSSTTSWLPASAGRSEMPERLQKILSAAGIASRRAAENLIREGRVSLNGRTVTELGTKADPESDDVRVDGRRVKPASRRRYILLYKPRGYITTRSDPQQRPTVIDLLTKGGVRDYVYPVGRLDYDSEGLLLLTSDGDLAARLTHPRHGVAREYQVRVRGVPDHHALERLGRGIMLEGRRTAPAEVTLEKVFDGEDGSQAVLSVVIHEGRNRQVRNMCDAIGHPVIRLKRVRIGPISDERIRPGEFRDLTDREIAQLKRAGDTPTKGPPRSERGSRPPSRSASGRPRRA